jgi:hypothetical protein
MMPTVNTVHKSIALVCLISGLGVGGAIAYRSLNVSQDCVRLNTTGGQEVTYSRGCLHPQRYKKWVINASKFQGGSPQGSQRQVKG